MSSARIPNKKRAKYPPSTAVHRVGARFTLAGAGWPLADGSWTPFIDSGPTGSTPFADGSCRTLPPVAASPSEMPFGGGDPAGSTPFVDGDSARLPFVDAARPLQHRLLSDLAGHCRPLPLPRPEHRLLTVARPLQRPFVDGAQQRLTPFVDGGQQPWRLLSRKVEGNGTNF